MKNNHFVFDVDGTLTPSRKKIQPQFAIWFLYFAQQNSVSLVIPAVVKAESAANLNWTMYSVTNGSTEAVNATFI